jgi:two-component system, OmpR family, response regulator
MFAPFVAEDEGNVTDPDESVSTMKARAPTMVLRGWQQRRRMKILIVEDDAAIASALAAEFAAGGDQVWRAASLAEARRLLEVYRLTAVILDLGLPDGNGLELLHELRALKPPVPTIIMTARDGLRDRVRGLDAGADDYIVKPFAFAELQARLRAVLRRSDRLDQPDRYGAIERRPDDPRYFLADQPLDLSRREYAVFTQLWMRRERVVSKSELLQAIDPTGNEIADPAIEVYVHRLRRKLEGCDVQIRTLRGFGYLLQAQRGQTARESGGAVAGDASGP